MENLKLIIQAEVEIPTSKNCTRNSREDERLYGNDEAVAFFEITYNLMPQTNFESSQRLFPEWQKKPEVRLVSCSAFYSDEDGGEHERDYDLTEGQYEAAKEEALKYAKSLRSDIRVKVAG